MRSKGRPKNEPRRLSLSEKVQRAAAKYKKKKKVKVTTKQVLKVKLKADDKHGSVRLFFFK